MDDVRIEYTATQVDPVQQLEAASSQDFVSALPVGTHDQLTV